MNIDESETIADLQVLSEHARAALIRSGITRMTPTMIDSELRVVTERSVWLIRSDRYLRLPLTETERAQNLAIDSRLDDARWHGLREAWWCWDTNGELRVRLLPVSGPEHGAGVLTGVVTDYRTHR